ncbi:MAG: hypothetical protein EHM48_04850 [Planctomycetaceae bacterium]|nr:MAG: hypothetical protein EHM48_04850 [Planctomycetaceae bacterium]
MPLRPPLPDPISEQATAVQAAQWLRELVRFVGPGFHPDTPFSDYVNTAGGSPSFTAAQCEVLELGLKQAWTILSNAGVDVYAAALTAQRRMLSKEF